MRTKHFTIISQAFIFITSILYLAQATDIDSNLFSSIPSYKFENVTATSTNPESKISCFSPHNQLYTNNIEFDPPPPVVLEDNDFTISIIFTATLNEQRFLLIYYNQTSYENFFGLYVTPGSSEVGITYQTCSGVTNVIPIYNPVINNQTEVFLAISISPVNSTHIRILSLIGTDTDVSTIVADGSLECSFPGYGEYATHLIFDSEGEPTRFYGSSKNPVFVGRSLTPDEMVSLRTHGALSGDSCHTDCVCPKDFEMKTESCCYNSQTNNTSFRLTTDTHSPELATDDNPCTYWESSSDEEHVSFSFSLAPTLSELQLIQIQFISPPASFLLSVTSLENFFVVARVDSTCDSATDDTTDSCSKNLYSTDEIPCCVTTEQLITNPVFEILFSVALQGVSSLTLSLSEFAPSSRHYSISEFKLFSLAGLDIPDISSSSILVTSTIEHSRTSLYLSSTTYSSTTVNPITSLASVSPITILTSSLLFQSSSILTNSINSTSTVGQSSRPTQVATSSRGVTTSSRVYTSPVPKSSIYSAVQSLTQSRSPSIHTTTTTTTAARIHRTDSIIPVSSTFKQIYTSSSTLTTRVYPPFRSFTPSLTQVLPISTPTVFIPTSTSAFVQPTFTSTILDLPTSTILDLPTSTILDLPTSTILDLPTSTILDLPTSTILDLPTSTILDLPTSTILDLPTSTILDLPTSTFPSTIPTSRIPSVLPTSDYLLPTSTYNYVTSSSIPTSIIPTSTPVPPTPTPTPILPCIKPIPSLYLDITVPTTFGYKQYHFTNTSFEETNISVIQTGIDTYSSITVHIPFGLTKTYSLLYSLPTVSRIEYVIHSATVWYQDNHFPVSITGLDLYDTFNFRETGINLTLTHNYTSISKQTTLSRAYSSRTIIFTIPESWFSSSLTSITPSLIIISNKLLINSTLSLMLQRPPDTSLLVPTNSLPVVIITLPQFPLRTGQTVVLPVYLLASSGARYVAIQFNYPDNSSLVNLNPSYSWELNTELNTVVISGFINIQDQQQTPVKLFDINLLYFSNDSQVSCQLKELLDTTYTRTSPSLCYFSSTRGVSPSPGYLQTSPEIVISISTHPQYSVTYNHAVFTQSLIKIPVYARVYTNNGVKTDPNLLSCYSSDSSVLKIATSCAYLYLDGSELSGSRKLTIHFSIGDIKAEFTMKVFYPEIPITLALTDPILNEIPVYPGTQECVQTFQSSKLVAYTNFSASNEVTADIDVSEFIRGSLFVSDTLIAEIGDDMYLRGKSTGVGQIFAEIRNTQIGHAVFAVSVNPVEVSCYSPHLYSDYNTDDIQTELYQSVSLDVSLSRTFLYNSTRGYSLAFLQFSDDSIQPTSHYILNATNILIHEDTTFSLLNDSVVIFNLPASCTMLSPVPFKTDIDLLPPDHFLLYTSSNIITIAEDSATQLGYQPTAELRITLVYGSNLVDATNAVFIRINIDNVNVINRITMDAGVVLEGLSSGQTEVAVSLAQATKSLSIQVISVSGLKSYLLASYSSNRINTLSKLTADTFQTGRFVVEVLLSNSQTILITNTSLLTLQVRENSGQSDTEGPLTNKAYFLDDILYVNSSLITVETSLVLSAVFSAFYTCYEVLIETDILSISNFSDFEVIPDLTGILGSQFPVNFGLKLSGGTEIPRYFGDSPTLPDLRFEVSDPFSVLFHSATGFLSLLGNSRGLVYLRVISGNVSRVSNGFAVNLSPFGNGIDLGKEDGLALPHQKMNSTFKLPIWLQTSSLYKSIDVTFSYEASVLSVVRVLPDSNFNGGIFQSQHNSLGTVRLGGIIPVGQSGERILIAELEVVGTQDRDGSIQAEVNSVSGPFPLYGNLLSYTSSPAVTNLTQVIYSQKTTPPSYPWSSRGVRSARSLSCLEKAVSVSGRDVCVRCSVEVVGDVNRDCVFNLNDVAYLLDYVTASYTGFSSTSGGLLKEEIDQLPLSLLDVNQDSEISITDVNYLTWVNFGLIYFFDTMDTSLNFPAHSLPAVYDCELSVIILLIDAPQANNRLSTYIELSYTDNSMQLLNITQGSYVTNTSRNGISSAVYQTDGFVLRIIVPADFGGQFYVSPIIIASDGTDNLQQTFTNHSLPSLNYPELRTTISFLSQRVSVYIPAGYSPYTSYTPSHVCGAPSVELKALGSMKPREFTLYWPQTGGRGPFSLKRVFCAMRGRPYNNIQFPCNRQITTNSDFAYPEYTVTGLNPYSVYQFQMEVNGVTSNWTQFNTPEAAPISLLTPFLTRYNLTCIYLTWAEPEITNGVIRSYSLILNDTISNKFTNKTNSHLLCGVDTDNVLSIVIQASNSAGSVRSDPVLSNSIGEPTVLSNRYNSTCVEIKWTDLIFNSSTNSTQESFIVSIDNTTVATNYNTTSLLVCDVINDGVPFYLEITSSRVGKIFADTVTIPLSPPTIPYYIILAILLPLLAALLLLLCCIAVVVCLWKSKKYSIFQPQKEVLKSLDYWSIEEEFVEVSPVDILPMEQRLFVPQQSRNRSETFDSSDSWMEKGLRLDVEQGLTINKHVRDHSFDSASLVITEIQDDSIFYCNTNNTTMLSDDLIISPRKYYSMRGRPRYLPPPASDIRKAKKSHSWHNLRFKRFKRSTNKLSSNMEDTTQVAGESITTVTDTTTSFNGFSPTQSMENNRASPTLIDVSTELYQNITCGDVDSEEERISSPLEVEDNSNLLDEATVLPKDNRSMLTRPSLDLSEGHVMGMTLAYEMGDLPLEENKPHPLLHDRSFTGLPIGEDVNQRRIIFQEPPDRSDDSDPQVFVILNNAVTSLEPINDSVMSSEPTNDSVIPFEPTNDDVISSEPTNDSVIPFEPTNDDVTSSEPTNDDVIPFEPTNDDVMSPESTNDVLIPLNPTDDAVTLPEPTNDAITLPGPTNDAVTLPEPTNDAITLPGPTNDAVTLPGPTNDVLIPLEPTNDAVTLPGPTNDAVTLLGPTNDAVTLPGPTNDVLIPLEPTNDAVTLPGPTNDVLIPLEPTNDAVTLPGPTNEAITLPGPTNDVLVPLEPTNDVVIPFEPSNDAVASPEPTNDTTETQKTDSTE